MTPDAAALRAQLEKWKRRAKLLRQGRIEALAEGTRYLLRATMAEWEVKRLTALLAVSSPPCRICQQQTHAKWHEVAQCELNPVALIKLLQSKRNDGGDRARSQLLAYVLAVTGIDLDAVSSPPQEEKAEKNATQIDGTS